MQAPSVERVEHLLALLEAQRPQVAEHSRRIATLAVRLASQYGLAATSIESIRVGSLLHDVGKLLVSQRILDRGPALKQREWEELTLHPEMGVELAERAGATSDACEIVLFHHERYDGRGYPDRLAGSAIPWPVRIVSVMDALDMLVYPTAHREPMSPECARVFIARHAGTQFCPWVVCGLLSMPVSMLETGALSERSLCIPDSLAAQDVLLSTRSYVPAS